MEWLADKYAGNATGFTHRGPGSATYSLPYTADRQWKAQVEHLCQVISFV